MLMLAVGRLTLDTYLGRKFAKGSAAGRSGISCPYPDTPLALLCHGRRRFAELAAAQGDLGYDQMIPSVRRRGCIQIVRRRLGAAPARERRRSLHFGNCRKKCGDATQIDCTNSLSRGRFIAQIRGVN
jgi:hypothetical protein